MKIINIKREFGDPFYIYLKKHYCPKCSTRLKITTVSKVVNPKSPEAKEYDFHFVDSFFIGDVKFIWTEFECPNCCFRIKADDLKVVERELKKRGKQVISEDTIKNIIDDIREKKINRKYLAIIEIFALGYISSYIMTTQIMKDRIKTLLNFYAYREIINVLVGILFLAVFFYIQYLIRSSKK